MSLEAASDLEARRAPRRRRMVVPLPASLLWIVAMLIAFLWSSTIFGICVALADRAAPGWWVVLPFGLIPLVGLFVSLDKFVTAAGRRASSRKDHAEPELGALPLSGPDAWAGDVPVVVEELTEREREVLALLETGRTNTEIAGDLYVAAGTIKSHVNSIYRKLGARNRTEAVARARRLQPMESPEG